MANGFFVGNVQQPAATGNQSVTGVGFQPNFLLFVLSELISAGSQTNYRIGIGVAAGSSDRRYVSIAANHRTGTGSTIAAINSQNTRCIGICSDGGLQAAADFVSFDSDGFTINWTNVTGTQRILTYVAMSVTSAKTGAITLPGSTGSQGITGVGFQPRVVIPFAGFTSATDPRSTIAGNNAPTLGWAYDSSNRRSTSFREANAVATSVARNKAIANFFSALSNAGVNNEADFTSQDSDGFTINWSAIAAAAVIYYAALAGLTAKVGVFDLNTSTGSQSVSGVGFQPSCVLVQSANKAATTTQDAALRWTIGAASASGEAWAHWIGAADAQSGGSQDVGQALSTSKFLAMYTEGTSPTLTDDASFTSFDSDGFTFNLTTASGTAKQVQYIAFAPATSTTPSVSDTFKAALTEAVSIAGTLTASDTFRAALSESASVSATGGAFQTIAGQRFALAGRRGLAA